MTQKQEELSFTYFPENYRWSHGLLIGLNMAPWGGAEIGEVNRIGLRLKKSVGDDDAWFREWAREARTVEDRGRERIAEGHGKSGAEYLKRASAYYHVGERFLQPKSKEGNDAYMRGVDCLREAAKYLKRPKLEHVEIPYGDISLPAIYVHAEPMNGGGKAPAMVFFDGLDVTKEIQYLKGVADLAARGIACLIVDGPGNGESIRFRNLYLRHATPRFMPRRPMSGLRRARKSMPGASASWRSASAVTMRRAPRPSSSALPAASPGARSGIIRKSGATASTGWRNRRRRHCRSPRNTFHGC